MAKIMQKTKKRPARAQLQRREKLVNIRKKQGGYTWIYYVIMLVISILSYVLRPKPPTPKPALLEEFDLPSPDEGTAQRVIFGERRKKQWEVLWYGNMRTDRIRTSSGK